MNSVLNTSQALHFTTNDLPLRDRVPLWRELFATKVVGVDFQPQTDTPFEVSGIVHILPGLCVVSPYHSTPARLHRTSRLIADGDDSVGIVINLGGALTVSHRGRTGELDGGGAVTILHTEPAIAELESCLGQYQDGVEVPAGFSEIGLFMVRPHRRNTRQ